MRFSKSVSIVSIVHFPKVFQYLTLGTLFSDKRCNDPSRLYGDEPKVFYEIFSSVEKHGRYSVHILLKSKSFRRVFGSSVPMAPKNQGEEQTRDGAPSSSGDSG